MWIETATLMRHTSFLQQSVCVCVCVCESWQTKLEATPRSSAVMRKFLGEAVVFRIQIRTRSVPLRLL